MNHSLVDTASGWIDRRKAAYLAKENVIVYYDSLTGRKSDFTWIRLSLIEAVRVMRATLMNPSDPSQMQTEHVIAACQELGRVFEFGVKSRHETKPEIFNYLKESDMDLGDAIASMLAEEVYAQGYMAITVSNLMVLMTAISVDLGAELKDKDNRTLLYKHFPTFGYEVRTDQYRPLVDGKKQSSMMQVGTKPKDVCRIMDDMFRTIVIKISGALK